MPRRKFECRCGAAQAALRQLAAACAAALIPGLFAGPVCAQGQHPALAQTAPRAAAKPAAAAVKPATVPAATAATPPAASASTAAVQSTAQALPARTALCAACHGAEGNSIMPNSPSLAGQPRIFVENTLVMIREGVRKIAAMQGMMNGVTDQEITALARYFAAQTPVHAPEPRKAERFARGEALAARTHCASCHLPSYAGREQMPRLAGQREDYLLHSMKQFLDGSAAGRDTIMAAALHGMNEEDLRDLAHYLAQLR